MRHELPSPEVELDEDLAYKRLVYEGLVITIESAPKDQRAAARERAKDQWSDWFIKDYLNE